MLVNTEMKNWGSCWCVERDHPCGWQNHSIPSKKGVSGQSCSGKRCRIFPFLVMPPGTIKIIGWAKLSQFAKQIHCKYLCRGHIPQSRNNQPIETLPVVGIASVNIIVLMVKLHGEYPINWGPAKMRNTQTYFTIFWICQTIRATKILCATGFGGFSTSLLVQLRYGSKVSNECSYLN